MRSIHSKTLVLSVACTLSWLVASGCGSSEEPSTPSNPLKCGSGTVQQGDQCVSVTGGAAGTSAQGGSSGSAGSLGGSAGTNQAGQSGTSGQGGSTMGSAGAGQSGAGGSQAGSAGNNTGGASGAAGTSGASGSGGGSGGELLPDTPCGILNGVGQGEELINGSMDCGTYNPVNECMGTNYMGTVVGPITSPDEFPFMIRTPSRPGVRQACVDECGPDNTVFSVSIKISIPYDEHKMIEIFEQPNQSWPEGTSPWKITQNYLQKTLLCEDTFGFSGCNKITTEPETTITIMTSDPQAPASNFRFYLKQDSNTTCEAM
jgi:hypothetical protein